MEVVLGCTLNQKLEHRIRANFARLLISLHMDNDPLDPLIIPLMTRVYSEVEDPDMELTHKDEAIPEKLKVLKQEIRRHLLS